MLGHVPGVTRGIWERRPLTPHEYLDLLSESSRIENQREPSPPPLDPHLSDVEQSVAP